MMAEYIIDLQSFVVEAENEEEARAKAIEMLRSGEETPKIDQVIEG